MGVPDRPEVEAGDGLGFIPRLRDGKCAACDHPDHVGACGQLDLFDSSCACPVRLLQERALSCS